MNLATTISSYVLATAVLAGGLTCGVSWLISSDGAPVAQAKPAQLPPRIAESIERRKAMIPPIVSLPPARPVMQEANVALRPEQGIKQVVREVARVPLGMKQRPRPKTPPATEINRPAALVTTARTDTPY